MTPVDRDRLARLYSRIACLRWSTARELEVVGRGGRPSPAMGSMAKLMWAEISQELAGLAVGLLGPAALEAAGRSVCVPRRVLDRRRHQRDKPEYRGRARSGAAPVTTDAGLSRRGERT